MAASESDNAPEHPRVLMTADAVGGVWQYAVDLLEELNRRGFESLLATMGPPPTEQQRRQIVDLPRTKLAESQFALEWMQDPWTDVDRAGEWLLDLESEFRPDVIHLNGYAHASLKWKRPVLIAAHSCVSSWWRAVYGEPPGPEWNEYKRRVMEGLRAAAIAIAPSKAISEALVREYGIEQSRIHVIHNFSQKPQLSVRNRKQRFVLAGGRIWDRAKNISLLDRIAPELNWEIRVAGNNVGPEGATDAGCSLCMLGPLSRPELLAEMEGASIFAHPALYEPFGLSVLEAAHRECCLVLSDIPSLRELWDDAAVFLDPHDPDRWIAELNRLIHDAESRYRFASLARECAARYDGNSAVQAYIDAYCSLLRDEKARKEAAA